IGFLTGGASRSSASAMRASTTGSVPLAAFGREADVAGLRVGAFALSAVFEVFFLAMAVLSELTGCCIAGAGWPGNPKEPETTENGQEIASYSGFWQRCN